VIGLFDWGFALALSRKAAKFNSQGQARSAPPLDHVKKIAAP
jgi:hypothetical protein